MNDISLLRFIRDDYKGDTFAISSHTLHIILIQSLTLIGCVLEKYSVLAAGSVLPADSFIPAGQLWAGNPAKYVRDVDDAEKKKTKKVPR